MTTVVDGNLRELEYFISEKAPVLVLSLMGSISKTSGAVIGKCKTEILQSPATYVIISLHDVPTVELGALTQWVQLQSAIRQKPAQLRLCFIRPEVREFLLEKGATRLEEVKANLQEALRDLKAITTKL